MTSSDGPTEDFLPRSLEWQLHCICKEFQLAWSPSRSSAIETWLERVDAHARRPLIRDLIAIEVELRRQQGEAPRSREYLHRFSEYEDDVKAAFQICRTDAEEGRPERIGRYEIEQRLGRGAFGTVYLARDSRLERLVAIKVAARKSFRSADMLERFLSEAKALADVDHPGIVTVHDVDEQDGMVFIVQEFVSGGTLEATLREGRVASEAVARWMIQLAEAIGYAHRRGWVHRDLKPANVLIEEQRLLIADLGLALHESRLAGHRGQTAGTPPYMAPEQVRGETHRFDGRTDIWALGVIFYEMLAGRRPFHGTQAEIYELIQKHDPQPPRQVDPTRPRELQRICLKCLERRMADRYSSAVDLAEDLADWLKNGNSVSPNHRTESREVPPGQSLPQFESSISTPCPVVPKGLRAFDREDAEFFLHLLPGPLDRRGFPDSVRFWKSRLDQQDSSRTFRVGLLYGPSGCGKSSLIKAGVIPRLEPHVEVIYFEATPEDTETRLRTELQALRSWLPPDASLAEAFAAVRESRADEDPKLVVIVDQFEQWLSSRSAEQSEELVAAFRQCDGGGLQAMLLVRDDFWMAATRFMKQLEVRLVEGRNSAAFDLFDQFHARRVLKEFGRAFGRLGEELTADQEKFLDAAVGELSDDNGKVISVHTAIFAQMLRGHDWTTAALRQVGGAGGLGINFLEHCFSSSSAPPAYRLNEKPIRQVLSCLLPEGDIKGQHHSYEHLLAASGLQRAPQRFDELLQILDQELYFITPTDPLTIEEPGESAKGSRSEGRCYQLTHDFLVQPLREWLRRKQEETWQGRVAVRADQRHKLWSRDKGSRFLLSSSELLAMLVTPAVGWSSKYRPLLKASATWYGVRLAGLMLILAGLLAVGFFVRQAARRSTTLARVEQVIEASPDALFPLTDAYLVGESRLAVERLRTVQNDPDPHRALRAALVLAHLGSPDAVALIDGIEAAQDGECENLVAALSAVNEQAKAELRDRVSKTDSPRARMRYAAVLLHLGDPQGAQQTLQFASNPRYRTAFIHGYPTWHARLDIVLDRWLAEVTDPAFRSGICKALALIPPQSVAESTRQACVARLSDLHAHAADAATHSAAEAALRRWRGTPPATPQPKADFSWQVHQGITFARIPVRTFVPGEGRPDNPAQSQPVTIEAPFWLSCREVTDELYQQYWREEREDQEDAARPLDAPNLPARFVSWLDAVEFCNWLSRRDGRTACYVWDGDPANQMPVPVPGANGYRLPSIDELESACRAGTATTFHFGNAEYRDVLSHYACYSSNTDWDRLKTRPKPCGSLLPNDAGLYDTLGNVQEWCWDATSVPQFRRHRGGSFYEPLMNIVCGHRFHAPMTSTYRGLGFRIALNDSPGN